GAAFSAADDVVDLDGVRPADVDAQLAEDRHEDLAERLEVGLRAVTIMYPPTISLASTNGPSIAPDAVSTLPLDLSLPPMSTTLSWNFAFQVFQTENISCICAGEGGFASVGLRWRNMYFWLGISSPCWLPTGSPAPLRRARDAALD